MRIPAVITAGDRRGAKAVYGESKVYLELGGRPLVAGAVLVLQQVAEVSEVWVVGNAERLESVLGGDDIRSRLRKPLHIVPQFGSLFENVWQTYRRLLPDAGPEGRDPNPDDLDQAVLYLSGDLPFATPQEISTFIQRSREIDCSYALGLVPRESLEPFFPRAPGQPGIQPAHFNLREGRFRQSNLHLAKPGRIINRLYIEEMYEHRHQREFGNMIALAWRLLRSEQGGLRVVGYYGLMHVAGIADRWGFHGLADRLRRWIPIARIEAGCSDLLRASFRFVITEAGGCAIDIDSEPEYDAAQARYEEWIRAQRERAQRLYGPPALEPTAGAGSGKDS